MHLQSALFGGVYEAKGRTSGRDYAIKARIAWGIGSGLEALSKRHTQGELWTYDQRTGRRVAGSSLRPSEGFQASQKVCA